MKDGRAEKPINYDAIVVLAHLMEQDGTLGTETRKRADIGTWLAIQAQCKLLLMGWAYRPDSSICISDAMANYVRSRYSFPASMMIIDRKSRDTVGDAVFSKEMLVAIALHRRIAIVTSSYHTARAIKVFRFVYGSEWDIDAIGAPVIPPENVLVHEAESEVAFKNTFAGIRSGDDAEVYWRLINRHPFYNGKNFPKLAEI